MIEKDLISAFPVNHIKIKVIDVQNEYTFRVLRLIILRPC